MRRRFAREAALQMLFQVDVGGAELETVIQWMQESVSLDPAMKQFAIDLVRGVVENIERIDGLLDQYSVGWEVSRMTGVDRNLLRLGIFEIFYRDDIPTAVTINEIVEISKKFGDVRSSGFVNGILGSIKRDLEEVSGSDVEPKEKEQFQISFEEE